MTRQKDTYRLKGRAVFLTAIMVLSMVAVGFVAVPAAAQDHDFDEDDYDREITGGETVYQGQLVLVNVSSFDDVDETELRRVDTSGDDDRVGALVSAPSILDDGDDNDYVILDTENRNADEYVVTNASRNTVITTDNAVRFEVVTQDLSAEFDDNEIDNEGLTDTEVEIDSEIRNTYVVNVSAEGLDYEDLEDIFTNAEGATWNSTDGATTGERIDDLPPRHQVWDNRSTTQYYLDEDEDVIVLFNAEGTHDLDFDGISEDEYEFDFEVFDSTASDSDTIDVLEGDEGDVGFVETTAIEETGDIVAMELEFDSGQEDASVSLGELDEVGYQLDFVVDADGESEVTIYFNSYYAGSEETSDDLDRVVWVDDDETDAEISDRSERGDEIEGLLDVGDYDVYVVGGDFSNEDPEDWDDEVIDNADDILLLTLTERSTDSLDIWTAPRGDASDLNDLESIGEAVEDEELTEADNIAKGDTMVLEVGASGLSGILETQGQDDVSEAFVNAVDDGSLVLEIEQNNPQTNRRAVQVNVSESLDGLTVVPNAGEDTYYVVADTRNLEFQRGSGSQDLRTGAESEDLDMRDGATFNAEFSVADEALLQEGDEVRGAQVDDSDDWETVESEFTFNDREVEFDDDPIEVYAEADQELTGTTTLAPGTELTIRATATDDTQPRFVKSTTVTVSSDRTVTGMMDFSEQAAGDTFEARLSGPAVDRDTVDGEVIEMEDEDTPTEDTPDEDTPDEDTPDEDTPDEDTPDEDTPTEEESPGFGIVVALVALIAAALLAVRRNDTL